MAKPEFEYGITPARRLLPQVIVATALVAVMPIVVVLELCDRGVVTSLWACLLVAIALALGASAAGSAYWKRRRKAADVMFSELLLWGWLRRLRIERKLADATGQLRVATAQGDVPVDREQATRMLGQMTAALEALDAYTVGHSQRVARHATATARRMDLPDAQVHTIHAAALVHDIGKLHVPREILDKPTRLSDEDFEIVKRHPVEGATMVASLGDPELTAIVRHHHERADGSGYPDGLRDEEIPVGARIVAVADTYDAIIAPRPYRGASPHKRAIDILREEAGTHFDAAVVEMFLASYSSSRLLAVWSSLAIAAKRAFAWPRATLRLQRGRPSAPSQHAATAAAMAVLAAVASAASLTHTAAASHAARSTSRTALAPPSTPPAQAAAPEPRAASRHATRRVSIPTQTPAPTPPPVTPATQQTTIPTSQPQVPSTTTTSTRAPTTTTTTHTPTTTTRTHTPTSTTTTRTATSTAPTTTAATTTTTTPPPTMTTTTVAPSLPSINSLTASCGALSADGGACTVQWSTTNTLSCLLSASPGLGYQLPAVVNCPSGVGGQTQLSFPPNDSSAPQIWTLTLTAAGAAGTTPASRQTTVTVAGAPAPAAPSIVSFTAACEALSADGGWCTVHWSVTNAERCMLTSMPELGYQLPAVVDCASGATGQARLGLPPNSRDAPQTWTLTLTVTGADGTTPATQSITIAVNAAQH